MSDRYNTQPDDATLETTTACPDGLFNLAPGIQITLPFRDRNTGLRARMTADQTEQACARMGLRLPTRTESHLMQQKAVRVNWEALPTQAMCVAAGVDSQNAAAVNTFRDNNMSSFAWAQLEDAYLDAAIAALSWNQTTPLMEAKWWFRDSPFSPPPGRGYLIGLDQGGTFLQAGANPGSAGPHGSNAQYDYLTLSYGVVGKPLTSVVPGVAGVTQKKPAGNTPPVASRSYAPLLTVAGVVTAGLLAHEAGWL